MKRCTHDWDVVNDEVQSQTFWCTNCGVLKEKPWLGRPSYRYPKMADRLVTGEKKKREGAE